MTEPRIEYNSLSDFELAQASSDGDNRAFEVLYIRHHRLIYSLCLRMTRNSHLAEDLTQETFVQLFRKVGTFNGDSKFSTWLHRMAVNQVLMYFRKSTSREEPGTEHDTVQSLVEQNKLVRPNDYAAQIDIQRALSCLPDGYYNVFILHDIQGFQHKEVSKILGVSEGTSKSQLHKARQKLRKELKKRKMCEKVFDWRGIENSIELLIA